MGWDTQGEKVGAEGPVSTLCVLGFSFGKESFPLQRDESDPIRSSMRAFMDLTFLI